jgi:hypothetical protein
VSGELRLGRWRGIIVGCGLGRDGLECVGCGRGWWTWIGLALCGRCDYQGVGGRGLLAGKGMRDALIITVLPGVSQFPVSNGWERD